MNVLVEQCWSGGADYHYRLTVLNGRHKGYRCNMAWRMDERWNRDTAASALNVLQRRLGVARGTPRFVHK